MDRSVQADGSALALEHALIMLLLLVGSSIRRQQHSYVPWVVLVGMRSIWIKMEAFQWSLL